MNAQRQGRGKARASIAIIDEAYTILDEIQPATVRAVCYRLFAAGLIPNMGKTATGKVSRLLVGAREDGVIPWEWIVDETRAPEYVNSWDNPDALIGAAIRQYRKDYWTDQPNRVEVWSEKGTVRGTIAPVLHELGVTFRVMHGYGSATSIHSAAADSLDGDKLLTVLYVGDWDPSGLHMSEVDLPARIERYNGVVHFQRIALDKHDVAPGTTIPHFEVATKVNDPRFQWYAKRYGTRCWELDALSPVTLRERVRDAIVDLLDMTKWNRAVEVEKAERESMHDFLDTWHRTISIPVPKYPEGQR
ncbi:MAG: hypothetical protein ACREPS_08510 [Rhodanobacteraceae bacterium]